MSLFSRIFRPGEGADKASGSPSKKGATAPNSLTYDDYAGPNGNYSTLDDGLPPTFLNDTLRGIPARTPSPGEGSSLLPPDRSVSAQSSRSSANGPYGTRAPDQPGDAADYQNGAPISNGKSDSLTVPVSSSNGPGKPRGKTIEGYKFPGSVDPKAAPMTASKGKAKQQQPVKAANGTGTGGRSVTSSKYSTMNSTISDKSEVPAASAPGWTVVATKSTPAPTRWGRPKSEGTEIKAAVASAAAAATLAPDTSSNGNVPQSGKTGSSNKFRAAVLDVGMVAGRTNAHKQGKVTPDVSSSDLSSTAPNGSWLVPTKSAPLPRSGELHPHFAAQEVGKVIVANRAVKAMRGPSPTRSEESLLSDVSGVGALPRDLRDLYSQASRQFASPVPPTAQFGTVPAAANGHAVEPETASVADSIDAEDELMDAILLLESAKGKLAGTPASTSPPKSAAAGAPSKATTAAASATSAPAPAPAPEPVRDSFEEEVDPTDISQVPKEFPPPDLSTPYDPPKQERADEFGPAQPITEPKKGFGRVITKFNSFGSGKRRDSVAPAKFQPPADLGAEALDMAMTEERRMKQRWKMFIPPLYDKARPIRSIGYFWSLAQMIIIIGLEIGVMVLILQFQRDYLKYLPESAQAHTNIDSLIVYEAMYMVGLLFQWLLYIDSDFSKSSIQLLALLVFQVLLWTNSLIQYYQGKTILNAKEIAIIQAQNPKFDYHPTKYLEATILGLNTVFFFGWLYIVWRLYKAYGWEIYKQFGADLYLRNRVILQHIFLTLLKLDVFFYFGFGRLRLTSSSVGTNPFL